MNYTKLEMPHFYQPNRNNFNQFPYFCHKSKAIVVNVYFWFWYSVEVFRSSFDLFIISGPSGELEWGMAEAGDVPLHHG